jgi:VWFA-related protein
MVLAGQAGGGPSSAGKAQDPESYRIAVDVDLVVLHPAVRDRKGRFVSDLREQDFEVYEDGVRQTIRLFQYEDTPVTVGLVVDHSRSMRTRLAQVTAAAGTFARFSNTEDQIFVVNFNENVSLGLPASIPFTNSYAALQDAIANAPAAGMTALYDAIVQGLEHLHHGSRDKKVLLVISDGADNASGHSLSDILKIAQQSSAIIYTVGLFDDGDPDRNPKVLKRLAEETGGEAFFPGQPGAVVSVCEGIAHDIRNQYTIGYVSTNTTPKGVYRPIRVIARSPNHGRLFVRTRAGYLTSGRSPPVKNKDSP